MRKRIKVMLLGVITALTLALPLAAQNYNPEAFSLSSNTKTATATIFTTDVDNFINYHKYSGVKFDKGFGFITGSVLNNINNFPDPADKDKDKANPATGRLSAGYAHNFGSLYLGAWYTGNIYQNTSDKDGDKTTSLKPTYDNDDRTLLSTVETTKYKAGWINTTNQLELLLGIAGQGIKVGFYESLATNENEGNPTRDKTVTDHKNGVVEYENTVDEYTVTKGTLKPYLGWGTNIGLGGGNLMPYVDLSMDIFSDTLVDNFRDYTKLNGKKISETASVGAGNNEGYLRPRGTVGAKFDLAKKETVQTTLEFKYGIDLYLYSNSYEATGLKGDSVDGTVKWDAGHVNRVTKYLDRTETNTDLTLKIDEKTSMSHTITPIYKITGEPAEGLRLGFLAQVPVRFQSRSSNQYSEQYKITTTKYLDGTSDKNTVNVHTNVENGNTETSELSAGLDFNLGASYKLIPDRFTINAGVGASPTKFTQKTVKAVPNSVRSVTKTKTVDRQGNVTTDKVDVAATTEADSVTVTNTWEGYTGTIRGGFMFNFTPQAALDLGLTANANSFTIDLADVNVLFSIKY